MTATTSGDRVHELVDRINALAAERAGLYRRASEGLDAEGRARLKAIDAELALLWEERRRAGAGRDDADVVPVRNAA